MQATLQDKLQALKRNLRSYMNGPLSQSLRDKGLGYRVIFGIEWPRLVKISHELGKDHDLAQALWKEDIRECRLLAGLVQPVETFYPEIAEIWVDGMRYPEEAQYTVLSLLQYMPDASQKAFEWIADGREMVQLCGWLLLTRLFMKGNPLMSRSESEFVDQAEAALNSSGLIVRQAVCNAVRKYALIGPREEHRLGKILQWCNF